MSPSRPALRYLGGKWRLAHKIIAHFPQHRIYTEPFGGAASVLLQKSRSYAEIYNDLDGDVVNLFRVLRDQASGLELARAVALTPFARDEFDGAYEMSDDPVERARRLVARSYMGFGNIAYRIDRTTGFRRNANRSGTTPAHDWGNLPPAILEIVERMAGVVVENRPALEILEHFDGPDTLHYVDPPYVHVSRSNRRHRNARDEIAPSCGYAHELNDLQHADLLQALDGLRGMVVLSGYATSLYDSALPHWSRFEMSAHADGARDRTEVLWVNQAAAAAHGLFAA